MARGAPLRAVPSRTVAPSTLRGLSRARGPTRVREVPLSHATRPGATPALPPKPASCRFSSITAPSIQLSNLLGPKPCHRPLLRSLAADAPLPPVFLGVPGLRATGPQTAVSVSDSSWGEPVVVAPQKARTPKPRHRSAAQSPGESPTRRWPADGTSLSSTAKSVPSGGAGIAAQATGRQQ